uniref:Uncharacterized protein n=1 Tax=Trypanosoma congolense (strain IL3000) TaxID=1068625 RepID=G0UM82_TRYCI|nr:hypothetical protein TCIL3000_5_5080 [Trypanosoma congolense IL3000]
MADIKPRELHQTLRHRLPQKDRQLAPRYVNVTFHFMGHKRAKILPDNAVPYPFIFLLELSLYIRRHAVFQRLAFKGLDNEVSCLFLHVLCHICIDVELMVFGHAGGSPKKRRPASKLSAPSSTRVCTPRNKYCCRPLNYFWFASLESEAPAVWVRAKGEVHITSKPEKKKK